MLWLWELRDIGIIGVGLLISVLALTQTGIALPQVMPAEPSVRNNRSSHTVRVRVRR